MLETEAVIKRFRDYVIQQSRSNLSKSKHNNTKGLYNSIKGEIVTENGFTIVGYNNSGTDIMDTAANIDE